MMKNLISKNLTENNFKNTMYCTNSSKSKLRITELKINTNNNENLSPNSHNSKSSGSNINFPTTTKNLTLKKTPTLSSLNAMPNGSMSSKNSEHVLEKKIFKISSITELNKKKSERKLFSNLASISNKKDLERRANLDKVKISHKNFGVIEAYAAITTEGLCRDYNEDRVAIIFNISKPPTYVETQEHPWPKCSFFGLYDGHGGVGCADFLRDNLHKFIINDANFPKNPQKAILNGFIKSEKTFIQKSKNIEKTDKGEKINILDRSGSCAIVVLIIEKRCYIANVGDSRAIMSGNFGEKVYSLSRDHRPCDEKEYQRILDAGGKIYQTEANLAEIYGGCNYEGKNTNILGPLRVVPGKLSVCRTLGDIEAKDPRCGGNPNVVISTPEIKYFDINSTNDFIVIGCDGVFEKLKNKEIIENLWKVVNNLQNKNVKDIHNLNGVLMESFIEDCFSKRSTDNLTAIIISFKDNLLDRENHIGMDYISQTQQINKIPKVVKTESNQSTNIPSGLSQNQILSKIIKSSQIKLNSMQSSERFMTLNK